MTDHYKDQKEGVYSGFVPSAEEKSYEREISHLRTKLAAAEAELSALREDKARLEEVMTLIAELRKKVAVPPKAITWEDGVGILDFVQDEFLPACKAIDAARKEQGKV